MSKHKSNNLYHFLIDYIISLEVDNQKPSQSDLSHNLQTKSKTMHIALTLVPVWPNISSNIRLEISIYMNLDHEQTDRDTIITNLIVFPVKDLTLRKRKLER